MAWNYDGLIGNYRRMKRLDDESCRALHKWLNRRRQGHRIRWRALNRRLQRFQVPHPRLVERNGRRMPCQRDFSFCQGLLLWPVTHPSA